MYAVTVKPILSAVVCLPENITPISPNSETFAYVLNKIEALRSCFLFISFVKHHQGVEAKL